MEPEQPIVQTEKKKSSLLWIVLSVIILLTASGAAYVFLKDKDSEGPVQTAQVSNDNSDANATDTPAASTTPSKVWRDAGVTIAGKFADPEIMDLGNGQYRMFYAAEPEIANFDAQLYSAVSTDGINWTDEGLRRTKSTFPDIIKLSDGRWRMYFQNGGGIKSAISSDGLNFTDEAGVRVDKAMDGFALDNVAASSTTILDDGTYLMIYRGTIDQPYEAGEKIPNDNTQLYFYATSTDGLTFEKKGLAVDSRSQTLYGLADGGEWVKEDDGELRAYFWSYTGIYYSKYENDAFSNPEFLWTNNQDKMVRFSPNPPSDPTFMKIGETWFMYYGQHEKGIFYAKKQ